MSQIIQRIWKDHGRFLLLLLGASGITRALAGMITGISFSVESLPLLIWASMIPLAAYAVATGILVGQTLSPRIISLAVALHPGLILSAEVTTATLGLSTTFLIFVALALQSFNFPFCTIPRHIIETTLMYAPEIGFLSSNYDLLVDEIGYNELYSRNRALWLCTTGLFWGALMTVSIGFAALGCALIALYFSLSTWWRALVKTTTVTTPALALLAVQHFGASRIQPLNYQFPTFNFLLHTLQTLALPTWMLTELPTFYSYICIGLDVIIFVGFIGSFWRMACRHFAFCHAAKVVPFFFAALIGIMYYGEPMALWMLHPIIVLLSALFWYELMKIETVLATYTD